MTKRVTIDEDDVDFDEDLLRRSIAVKTFAGRVAAITALTPDAQKRLEPIARSCRCQYGIA